MEYLTGSSRTVDRSVRYNIGYLNFQSDEELVEFRNKVAINLVTFNRVQSVHTGPGRREPGAHPGGRPQ